MTSFHHSPVLDKQRQPRDTPSESAFNGVLISFESTEAEVSRDLENSMGIQKPKIYTFNFEQLSQGTLTNELCEKCQVIKFLFDEPDLPEENRIEKYAKSIVAPVFQTDGGIARIS